MDDVLTVKALNDIIKTLKKSTERQDFIFIGYPGMREKIREAGFTIDDYRYVEVNSTLTPTMDEDQVWIVPATTYEPDIRFAFKNTNLMED